MMAQPNRRESQTEGLSIVERPVEVPLKLERVARKKGWTDGLLRRALELRVCREDVDWWLTHDTTVEQIERILGRQERLTTGTLRAREATWADDEALADLYANAPEEIGDWEVTVERSPYPFAQFRLQEHANIQVVEDRGVILGAAAHSGRNTVIDGQRVSTHVATAWRVRKDCRGMGFSGLLQSTSGPACAWFGLVSYWYVRSGNYDALGWIRAVRPDLTSAGEEPTADLPGLPVTVHHFQGRLFDGDPAGIRRGRRSDTRRCVSLINRTHRGLDFFRPYSDEYLQQRLDDPTWGPKPDFWVSVYTWDDFYVLEEEGRIVACGGLWDQGRHMREVWHHKETGERHVVERTALMDYGYAEGREDAMARLLQYFIGRTHELGRHELMAPIEQLPPLVEGMAGCEPVEETRAMSVDPPPREEGFDLDIQVTRPYTDLAYW